MMKMMKRLLSILLFLAGIQTVALAQTTGELKGTITEEDGKTPIPFANVVIEENNKMVTGQSADIDGNYWIKNISVGTYTVKFSSAGLPQYTQTGVNITAGSITFLSPKMKADVTLKEFVVSTSKIKIDPGNTSEGGTYSRKEIMNNPSTTTLGIVNVTAGVYTRDGAIQNFAGSRQDATIFIDGVKVRGGGSTIPRQGAESVNAILGGVPAKYGDVTGGIIEITTRNISNQFFGAIEGRTSQFLDNFGHHYVSGVIGGPMIKRKGKEGKPLAGFMLALEAGYDLDPTPGFGGWYRATDDARNRIINDPLRLPPAGQSGTRLNAEYLGVYDFEKSSYRLNADRQYINGNAKIDINPAKNTFISIGGYVNARQQKAWDYNNSMFNWDRNGRTQAFTWNIYGRITQYFEGKKDDKGKYKGLKNAMISLQVDYLKGFTKTEDVQHENRFFNYGYVGKFDVYRAPTYAYGYDDSLDMSGYLFTGYQDTSVAFTPSSINDQIAAVTSQFYSLYPQSEGFHDQLTSIINTGGIINGYGPDNVYDMYRSPGFAYNGYSNFDNNQFRINFTGTATIGDHDIGLGFEFEQRTDASYTIAPVGLWTIARQLTGSHLGTLDLANGMPVYNSSMSYQDTINYNPLYVSDPLRPGFGLGQSLFDYNLRQKLGLSVNGLDYINIDGLDPDFFDLNMFATDELYNSGNNLITHIGYDAYGNRVEGRSSFEDFFLEKDANGFNTRPTSAFQPIYMAGYIQDKFSFKDIVFSVGVRIDRFDANQKVLKDQYSLYDTRKAGDVDWNLFPSSYVVPGNVEDDWVVYVVDENNPTSGAPLGFRDGDTWYNADGEVINDPTLLRNSSGRVQPYLTDPATSSVSEGGSKTVGAGLFNAFTDYVPQVNVMPRISFSFPISEKTLFSAYYDVLTQRPTLFDGNQNLAQMNPLDYLFWDNASYNTGNKRFNNPNLRPERTTEFSLSFRQILTESILFKIRAFYKELRDMIAVVKVQEAYPRTYTNWSNIDFATVKGLSAEIILAPQSGNISLTANYTLQFADGTGSNSFSQLNLINSGQPNLRSTIPLGYDTRHQFKLFGVFNFGETKDKDPSTGTKYMGPRGKFFEAIFRNLGVSMTLYGNSGVPYSRQVIPTPTQLITGSSNGSLLGSLNGARLPFEFYNDLSINKDITLFFGKKKENNTGRKRATLQLYINIQNLFNVQNIVGVYAATGSPTDDGYLTAPNYEAQILSQVDPTSYMNYYNMKVNDPYNYSMPRRVRFGAILSF